MPSAVSSLELRVLVHLDQGPSLMESSGIAISDCISECRDPQVGIAKMIKQQDLGRLVDFEVTSQSVWR